MPSEWEKRGLSETEAISASKEFRAPSYKFIILVGLVFGCIGFFITLFSTAIFGFFIGLILIMLLMNFAYLLLYPHLLERTLAGDLGYIGVHITCYFAGYFLTFFIVRTSLLISFG